MTEVIGKDAFYLKLKDVNKRHGGVMGREQDIQKPLTNPTLLTRIICEDGYSYIIRENTVTEWADLYDIERKASVRVFVKYKYSTVRFGEDTFACFEQRE